MILLICGVQKNKTNGQRKKREQPKNRFLTIENTLMVTKGEVGGGWEK